VVLDDVRFNMPYNRTWDNTSSSQYNTLALLMQQELAAMLGVGGARIQIAQIDQSDDGQTLVTIVITPPQPTQVARRRAIDPSVSAEELAFLFLALFDERDNETTGNQTSPFGNSSLLSSLDTSSLPAPRVEASAAIDGSQTTATTTIHSAVDRAIAADADDSQALSTVVLVFVILIAIQGCVILWLLSATRLTGIISRMLKQESTSSTGVAGAAPSSLKTPRASTQLPARASFWSIADVEPVYEESDPEYIVVTDDAAAGNYEVADQIALAEYDFADPTFGSAANQTEADYDLADPTSSSPATQPAESINSTAI
jgi:hypothetical protein